MNSKKRMMFILEEDYYFITIKLLSILKALDCDIKPFEDYRKLGIIFEFVKSQENTEFLEKLINQKEDIAEIKKMNNEQTELLKKALEVVIHLYEEDSKKRK